MRTIRFFPDWGRKEPLWDSGSENYVVHTSELPITAELKSDLHEYMKFWHHHLDEISGWDSETNERWFSEQGDWLVREVCKQLEGVAIVVDDR